MRPGTWHSRGFTAAKWDDYQQACAAASTDRVVLVPGIGQLTSGPAAPALRMLERARRTATRILH